MCIRDRISTHKSIIQGTSFDKDMCYILIVQSIITVILVKELIVNKVYKDRKSEKGTN